MRRNLLPWADPINNLLDLQQVDPSYHLVFDDGSQLALTSDMQSLQDQLESIEPGAYQGFLRYHEEGAAALSDWGWKDW